MGENRDTLCKCDIVGENNGINQSNFSKIGSPVLAPCVRLSPVSSAVYRLELCHVSCLASVSYLLILDGRDTNWKRASQAT